MHISWSKFEICWPLVYPSITCKHFSSLTLLHRCLSADLAQDFLISWNGQYFGQGCFYEESFQILATDEMTRF